MTPLNDSNLLFDSIEIFSISSYFSLRRCFSLIRFDRVRVVSALVADTSMHSSASACNAGSALMRWSINISTNTPYSAIKQCGLTHASSKLFFLPWCTYHPCVDWLCPTAVIISNFSHITPNTDFSRCLKPYCSPTLFQFKHTIGGIKCC